MSFDSFHIVGASSVEVLTDGEPNSAHVMRDASIDDYLTQGGGSGLVGSTIEGPFSAVSKQIFANQGLFHLQHVSRSSR